MALTLNILFTKEQLVLIKHHYALTIPKNTDSEIKIDNSDVSSVEIDTKQSLD